MKYLISSTNDPFYNLAVEEYLIKHIEDDVFYLYINSPSVIIGKNQNPHGEVGIDYIRENRIQIVRRLSGGGAVYHDLNNLNYGFILKGKSSDMYDFKKFSQPIVDALNKLNLNVEFSGRNDLLIGDRKISGSAQFVHGENLLHHGTLLFNTNFNNIKHILTPNKSKLESKGVKSVKSRVANIKDFLPGNYDISYLVDFLRSEIGTSKYVLSSTDISNIEKIAKDKRESIDFIIKENNLYENQAVEYIPGFGTIQVYSNVEDGKISNLQIFGEYFAKNNIDKILQIFIGENYSQKNIGSLIDSIENFDDYFHKLSKEKLKEMIISEK